MKESELSDSMNESNINFLTELLENILVPAVNDGFDKPLSRTDFSDYLNTVESKFDLVLSFTKDNILSKDFDDRQRFKHNILPLALIICGEHSSSNLWTAEFTEEKSKWILKEFLTVAGFIDVNTAIIDDNCYVFKSALHKMRPSLLKETWKNCPAIVVCYSWLLHNIKSPNLSDHLHLVLPTALIITDDFVNDNRVIGLNCLLHIILNVGMTHLSWYSQDQVILKAIEPLFYLKDVELIAPLTKTFVALLMKKHPLKLHTVLEMNEFDDMIEKLLQNMTLEQELNLRAAYINILPDVIKARGLGILLHSPSLIDVISEYVLEPTSSLKGLEVLNVFIDVCWPRIHIHCNSILLLLSKVFLGMPTRGYPGKCLSELKVASVKLLKICPNQVEKFNNDLKKEESLQEVWSLCC